MVPCTRRQSVCKHVIKLVEVIKRRVVSYRDRSSALPLSSAHK